MHDKIDFKKTLDAYRARRHQFRILDVPVLRYMMIDGHGDPNTSAAFAEAIETLYPLAYAIKFASKVDLGRDYVVPPLEGMWSADDMEAFTTSRDKSRWDWTLMLMVPDWVGRDIVDDATERVRAKREPARLDDVRFEELSEGTCVQTLHVGSFDAEADVLRSLHEEFVPKHALQLTGRHHEIYLSDFRRVTPERQRTILRQPVEAARPG